MKENLETFDLADGQKALPARTRETGLAKRGRGTTRAMGVALFVTVKKRPRTLFLIVIYRR
jgi:hypothetical protein